jgi:NAD-dependent deacetylase
MLPQAAWDAAEAACQVAQVCLVIGTSAQVYPAAGLAELARRHGAQVIVVNPEATPLDDDAAYVLRGTAAHLVPALLGAAGR